MTQMSGLKQVEAKAKDAGQWLSQFVSTRKKVQAASALQGVDIFRGHTSQGSKDITETAHLHHKKLFCNSTYPALLSHVLGSPHSTTRLQVDKYTYNDSPILSSQLLSWHKFIVRASKTQNVRECTRWLKSKMVGFPRFEHVVVF